MENNNTIKEALLNSYTTTMKYLNLIAENQTKYNVNINTKDLDKEYKIINISITTDTHRREDCITYYNVYHTDSNSSITDIISSIRKNFKDNHIIIYAAIIEDKQVLKNTHFTLNMKINNEEEYQEVQEFNKSLNQERSKSLKRTL